MNTRKPENNKLPPRVYKDRSRYYFRPYLGRVNNKQQYGTPIRLCGLEANLSTVWREYEKVQGVEHDTLKWLLDTYHKSKAFKELAKSTQDGYTGYKRVITSVSYTDGSTFGSMALMQITRRVIRNYLDGYPGKVSANRHIQYLKSAWNWGSQRYESVPETNPCAGVDLNNESSRDRYVLTWEYELVHAIAASRNYPIFAPAMELAYLTRARRGEIFAYTEADILEDGLFLNRGKGSENEITLWNSRLKKAVEDCKRIYPNAPAPINKKKRYLLHNKTGRPYSKNALDSSWGRIMDHALNVGLNGVRLSERFTFHDLKARGVTDHQDKHSGHKSDKMKKVYDRAPRVVPSR